MNQTLPLKPSLAEKVIKTILNKFDKVEPIDVYYICVAIGQGLDKMEVVPSDLYYAIYLNQLETIEVYDLHQLSQITLVLSSDSASKHVPESFWTSTLVSALKSNLEELEKYKNVISTEAYVQDFSKVLVAFAFRGLESLQLTNMVLDLIMESDQPLSARGIENLLFFVDRSVTYKTDD